MSHQHFCNPTKTPIKDQEIKHFEAEARFERTIEDEAATIRRYSVKKFTQVITDKGEYLLGYEAPTFNYYYYRPGNMMFVAMHTSVCDCNMCEWMYKPPVERKKSPRHEPYQYGRRSPNNKERPRTVSPSPLIKAERSPSPPTNWTSPPVEQTQWDDLTTTCDWNTDPFKPLDETRELEPPTTTPKEKTTVYWRQLHYEAAQLVSKMDLLRLKICPNIPMYNGQRGYIKSKNAYLKIARAEDLLTKAFNGHITYRAAHREWIYYLGRCSHGTKFYSPEHECFNCNLAEDELDKAYDHGWTHVSNTV